MATVWGESPLFIVEMILSLYRPLEFGGLSVFAMHSHLKSICSPRMKAVGVFAWPHLWRTDAFLCVRVHLGHWPHFLFLHAKTIWINTGSRSICIVRYPKGSPFSAYFWPPRFFFFLLIVAEDSHMLRERINIFQPTDGLDAHAAGPIPSLVHPQTPHTFTLRARRADENRFEHTVLSLNWSAWHCLPELSRCQIQEGR